jgi:eukaryotic-like serine/threonine-protein kinase
MEINPEIERLFNNLADVPPQQRDQMMINEGVTPEVRSFVESLLANDDPKEDSLNGIVKEAVGRALEYPFAKDVRCGAYRLLELIGSGGMGSVYTAERADGQVRQKVAIKVLNVGIDTPSSRILFQKERQILADLKHPNIAHLLDAGHAEDGRPFFAMEFVDGVPIDEFCKQLPLRRQVELFEELCSAIVYAHRMLVIHRDIKPSNIMVDVNGGPKLLDFGIARLLDEATDSTVTGERRLTPQYASPEQIQGLSVGAASDIFSLGALLYRLVAGRAAFRSEDYPTRSELERAVCRDLAARPSQWNPRVDKDLEAIVAKAMRKEPNERYASADAFRDDVRAWLERRPVRARQGGWWYIARRQLRRHRISVAFATALLVLLAAFAIAQTLQVQRIARERNRADRVTSFMTGMFKVSDPSEARGNKVTAREILDKASDEISVGLVQDPELRAQMMHAMSTVYSNLGLVSRAEPLIRRTVQIQSQVLGPNHPDTLRSEFDLGISLFEEGRYEAAEKLQRRTMESLQRVLGPEHPDTLKSMNSLAIDLTAEGRYREAETLHRQILEVRRRLLGPEHYDTLLSMSNLAVTLNDQHRYAEAEAMERQTLLITNRTLGPDHLLTVSLTANLAAALLEEHHYAEAEPLLRRSLEVRRRVLGPEHRLTLNSMTNWALLLMYTGQYARAEEQLLNVRDIQRRTLGPDHPDIAASTYNLACVATRSGNRDAALLLLREALNQDPSQANAASIENDPDLQSLHSDPRFAALVTYAKHRTAASVKNK